MRQAPQQGHASKYTLRANDPHVFELTGLDPDAGYSYRLRFRNPGDGEFLDSASGDFLLLRGYLSQSASTVPLFLVLGNHDTERQSRLDGTPDNIGAGPGR